MVKLHFDIRDVFRSLRLGWSGKKMFIGFEGLALSYIGYVLCTYLAFWASGRLSPARIWDTYSLFPKAIPADFAWYGWIIYLIGVVFAAIVLLLFGSMICKVAHQELKGDDFYSMGDARGFLKKNWRAVVFSPVSLLGMFVFCGICGWIIGLLGRIPYVGEWGFALILVFTFFASLVTVYIGVVFLLSLILTPSIVGSTREDAMETIIQLFSTAWSQPWRLVIYEAVLGILVFVGTQVLAGFTGVAFWLINAICGLGMGDKLDQMAGVALHYLPMGSSSSCISLTWMRSTPWVSSVFPQLVNFESVDNGSILWAGRLLAIMIIALIGFVASYSFATWSSGQSLIYIALRKKKDDENLLERKDEREEEEEERERERKEQEKKEKEDKDKPAEEPQKEDEDKPESSEEPPKEE